MLPNSVTLTLESGTEIVMTKRSEQGGTSKYTGGYTASNGTRDVELEVKHTRPANKLARASSMAKILIHRYDNDGNFQKTTRCWTVVDQDNNYVPDVSASTSYLLNDFLETASVRTEFFEGSF